ncbi:MAG: nucleotidyl transferase AbiEii/AbiGii toxin family protein [Chthoniobacterales bacterium]|nr:nucleotidyl transferase AbiEii/AbiGii toxin family protein [Chthoniobacterales bacterium]
MDKQYIDTVRLLLEVAPRVFRNSRFAMKGGTALNLFVRNLPRLSVDIDVVFVEHTMPREAALAEIASSLSQLVGELKGSGLSARTLSTQEGEEAKILVGKDKAQVKVEVNYNFRGTLLPVEKRPIVAEAGELFSVEVNLPVLGEDELYGSKMVAALDRQHPRDLFDIREILAANGLGEGVVDCFVCYLAGHSRPIHEVLFSTDQPLDLAYEGEFLGLTRESVSLDELKEARSHLRACLANALELRHRDFLLSVARAEPEWSLMPFEHLAELPALRWKQENLRKLKKTNPEKFRKQADELLKRLG